MSKALEILIKHTGAGLKHAGTIKAMQEYATECVKASLKEASNNARAKMRYTRETASPYTEKSSITSPDNIVLV